jgi:hypothetical protein
LPVLLQESSKIEKTPGGCSPERKKGIKNEMTFFAEDKVNVNIIIWHKGISVPS